jgi:hypothetical protein
MNMRLGGPKTDFDILTKIIVPVKVIALIAVTMKIGLLRYEVVSIPSFLRNMLNICQTAGGTS